MTMKLFFAAVVSGLLSRASGSSNCTLGGVSDCCASLEASSLKNRLLFPGEAGYEARADAHWSLAARLHPSCILQPYNAAEVAEAVKVLVNAGHEKPCQFAVRSGGHTTWPGAASIDNGVTIDLQFLNSTTYHPENNTVTILPGARWGSVYQTLDPLGVNVAGGRAGSVGVGGYTVGGGNSFYAAREGFVCDNVLNFEVVLANGSIINANSETNSDLHTALKGGSINFGIVTRIDLSTIEGSSQLWGGVVTYPDTTEDQHIDALVKFCDNIENDPYASALSIFLYTSVSNQTVILNAYDYTKPVERPPIYDDFLAIPGNTSDTMRITNIWDITNELEQATGFRDTFLTLTFKNDARILKEVMKQQHAMVATLNGIKPKGDWNVQTLMQPVPTIFAKHGLEKGGNVMGLDRFDENLMLFQYYIAWEGADQDELFNGLADTMVNQVKAYSETLQVDNPFIYLDYADRTQNPLVGYGEDAMAKIKAAALKYDPTGVFQTMVPGGFKISKVA
ncbi:hypothetical protein F5884DRAFT_314949 [Xylogone sp. PMI_703]|nr:hypothetical protein F5884DRAFT_314949 [Xylogone sp. PMI_703]